MTYAENQFETIADRIHTTPDWLILGGPADANEAQCASRIYPNIKVIAFEPLPSNCAWQLQNGFPSTGILIQKALSNTVGQVSMNIDADPRNGHRCSSLLGAKELYSGQPIQVETTTLDIANAEYGPFTNAILWLDIEGSELAAIRGAQRLLPSGAVRYINLEMNSRLHGECLKITKILRYYGFRKLFDWNTRKLEHSTVKDTLFQKVR